MVADPSKRGSEELRNIFMEGYEQAVEDGGKDSGSALKAAECIADWFVESKQVREVRRVK